MVVHRVFGVIPRPREGFLCEGRKRPELSGFEGASNDVRPSEDQTVEASLIDSYRPAKLYDLQVSLIDPPPHRPLAHLQSLRGLTNSQKWCGRSWFVKWSHPRSSLSQTKILEVFASSSDSHSTR